MVNMEDELRKEMENVPKLRKRKRLFRLIFFAALILVFAGVIAVILLKHFFVVKEVAITETALYSYGELAAAAALEEGTPLISLDKEEIAARVEASFDFLSDVTVSFDLPGTVVIDFKEAYGDFCVCIGSRTFAVKGDLTVLADGVSPEDPGRITLLCKGIASCIVGEKMTFSDAGLEEMIPGIVEAVEEAGMHGEVQTLDLRDKFNIKLRYLGRFDVTIGENTNLAYKLQMLKKVVGELDSDPARAAEGPVTGSIDLTDANTAYYNPK